MDEGLQARYKGKTSRELSSNVSAADEVMQQAIDTLRRYHEALSCASLGELEWLKTDTEAKSPQHQIVPTAHPVRAHQAAALSPMILLV